MLLMQQSLFYLLILIHVGLIAIWLSLRAKRLAMHRRLEIEHIFDAIHNGPLQTLALLYRQVQSENISLSTVALQLEALDSELRRLYKVAEKQELSFKDYIYLNGEVLINLSASCSEILFQVFDHTLNRSFPEFENLKACIVPDFLPLDTCRLNVLQKRGLCLFLEEALCNIAKYGHHVTHIEVVCRCEKSIYSIEIINNNDRAIEHKIRGGYGTYQSSRIAKQLSGKIQRFSGPNNTFHCRLQW